MKEFILNTAINHLKKSLILKSAAATANQYMDKLNADLTFEAIELDELLSKLSPATDNLIINFEHDEQLTFIGGEIAACKLPQQIEDFSIQLKMYFKNKQERIILKEIKKNLSLKLITNKSAIELESKKYIEFELTKPEAIKNK